MPGPGPFFVQVCRWRRVGGAFLLSCSAVGVQAFEWSVPGGARCQTVTKACCACCALDFSPPSLPFAPSPLVTALPSFPVLALTIFLPLFTGPSSSAPFLLSRSHTARATCRCTHLRSTRLGAAPTCCSWWWRTQWRCASGRHARWRCRQRWRTPPCCATACGAARCNALRRRWRPSRRPAWTTAWPCELDCLLAWGEAGLFVATDWGWPCSLFMYCPGPRAL